MNQMLLDVLNSTLGRLNGLKKSPSRERMMKRRELEWGN